MSETLNLGDGNCVQPFALQFMEVISEAERAEISGRYNDKLQVWEYGDGKPSTAFPVASFPKMERPPTVSAIPTRITPKIVRSDMGPDD